MKNKLLKNLILPVLLFCGSFIYAQTVTGTVSDATGPLPGVNVLVKGTTNGTQTDFDGNYTLNNVNSGEVIVFSFLGYSTQEISYTGQCLQKLSSLMTALWFKMGVSTVFILSSATFPTNII